MMAASRRCLTAPTAAEHRLAPPNGLIAIATTITKNRPTFLACRPALFCRKPRRAKRVERERTMSHSLTVELHPCIMPSVTPIAICQDSRTRTGTHTTSQRGGFAANRGRLSAVELDGQRQWNGLCSIYLYMTAFITYF